MVLAADGEADVAVQGRLVQGTASVVSSTAMRRRPSLRTAAAASAGFRRAPRGRGGRCRGRSWRRRGGWGRAVASEPEVLDAEHGGAADDRAHVERLGDRFDEQAEAGAGAAAPVAVEALDVGGAQLPARLGRVGVVIGRGLPCWRRRAGRGRRTGRRSARRGSPGRSATAGGVGAEVLLDDEVGEAAGARRGSQARRRSCRAALPMRIGVGPDRGEAQRGSISSASLNLTLSRPRFWHCPQRSPRPANSHQLPNRRRRRTLGGGEGDGPVPAAEVEEVSVLRWRGTVSSRTRVPGSTRSGRTRRCRCRAAGAGRAGRGRRCGVGWRLQAARRSSDPRPPTLSGQAGEPGQGDAVRRRRTAARCRCSGRRRRGARSGSPASCRCCGRRRRAARRRRPRRACPRCCRRGSSASPC